MVLAMPAMGMESVMLRLSPRLMLSMEPMVDMDMDMEVFAKSFVNNENFNMEAVLGGHVEVKSEGDIDDTVKVDSKLNSLEKKKAENTEKKHKDKNKFDL